MADIAREMTPLTNFPGQPTEGCRNTRISFREL